MVAAASVRWEMVNGVRVATVAPHLALVARAVVGGQGRFVPMTAAEARGIVADELVVIDGPMFAACPGQEQRDGESSDAYYRRLACARPLYALLDRASGIDVPTSYPTRGATISITSDGRVAVADGATIAPGATFAMQGYPALLRRSANVANNAAGTNGQQNWRAGIGVTADGNIVFAVGRKDMEAFAAAMRAAGCVDAVYTDGGGSGRQESDSVTYGSSENRRVPVWIAALPGALRAVTPASAPAAPGSSWFKPVAAALAVLAGVAALFGARR